LILNLYLQKRHKSYYHFSEMQKRGILFTNSKYDY